MWSKARDREIKLKHTQTGEAFPTEGSRNFFFLFKDRLYFHFCLFFYKQWEKKLYKRGKEEESGREKVNKRHRIVNSEVEHIEFSIIETFQESIYLVLFWVKVQLFIVTKHFKASKKKTSFVWATLKVSFISSFASSSSNLYLLWLLTFFLSLPPLSLFHNNTKKIQKKTTKIRNSNKFVTYPRGGRLWLGWKYLWLKDAEHTKTLLFWFCVVIDVQFQVCLIFDSTLVFLLWFIHNHHTMNEGKKIIKSQM